VCLCGCCHLSKGSFIWHKHAHTERLQHHKVLGGQGTVAREAATACLNISDTGLIYLSRGWQHSPSLSGHHHKDEA